MQPILDTELYKVCSEGSLLVASLSLLPLHSHAFLGWTNPTGDFDKSFCLEQEAEPKSSFLYFHLWITNSFSNIVGSRPGPTLFAAGAFSRGGIRPPR
jgi:hypothetical protein